VRHITV
jgi:dynein regulatory complex protein 1